MSTEPAPRGIFVVFEGVEGGGKSTQCAILTQRLADAGHEVTQTIEPGGTPTGERVREWVKTGEGLTPTAELFLFNAARAALVETVIAPALDSGHCVVCDRYVYSTVAYQGFARGVDQMTIATLNTVATGGLEPDIVVLLDLPPNEGFGRKAGTALDRIELEDSDFHLRVRQGSLEQAQRDPDRWLVLDATLPESELGDAIWDRVSAVLGRT